MEFSSNSNIVSEISNYISENKTAELLDLFVNEKFNNNIQNNISSIITSLSSALTQENKDHKNELFESCKKSLILLAERHDQVDVVIGILQQMENDNEDTRYCTLLEPLLYCFMQKHDQMIQFLEWTIGTIKSYMSSIPKLPTDNEPESKNILDPYKYDKKQILRVHQASLEFLMKLWEQQKNGDSIEYLTSSVIYMFGPPFCYFEDKYWTEKGLLNRMMVFLFQLRTNVLEFLEVIQRKSRNLKQVNYLFESEEHVPSLAYANLFATIFTNETYLSGIAQVYHPEYIMHCCLYLVNVILERFNYPACLLTKGLRFAKFILQRVDKHTVETGAFEMKAHKDFLNNATQIMIYCDSDKVRKMALEVFRIYVDIFTLKARYSMIMHLYKTANHSGLLSLTTSIFKNSIIECLEKQTSEFLGSNMHRLLKEACKLEHGRMSDLIEISDEIITSLNLVRFLIIRDEKNETGIWDYIGEIDVDYLKPLRDAIEITRAHWQSKSLDLQKQKGKKEDMPSENVNISIGGKNLQMLPVEQKIKVCANALNGLDVIYSILTRINECLETHSRNS